MSGLALVRATHPLPCLAVTGFVTALGAAAGVPELRLATLAAAVLTGQMSVGWANDAIDADRDRTAGRRDKPVATGELRRRTALAAARVSLAADVPLSLAVGWRAGAAHLVAVGWAWLYDAGLKATPLSVVPYLVAFGLVPVVVAWALPGAPAPRGLFVVAAGCAAVAAHFANTIGDAAADARTGVRGLPQRLGEPGSLLVAAAAVAAAAGTVAAAVPGDPVALGLCAAAGTAALATIGLSPRGRRSAFRLVLLAVGMLVAAFVVSGGSLTG